MAAASFTWPTTCTCSRSSRDMVFGTTLASAAATLATLRMGGSDGCAKVGFSHDASIAPREGLPAPAGPPRCCWLAAPAEPGSRLCGGSGGGAGGRKSGCSGRGGSAQLSGAGAAVRRRLTLAAASRSTADCWAACVVAPGCPTARASCGSGNARLAPGPPCCPDSCCSRGREAAFGDGIAGHKALAPRAAWRASPLFLAAGPLAVAAEPGGCAVGARGPLPAVAGPVHCVAGFAACLCCSTSRSGWGAPAVARAPPLARLAAGFLWAALSRFVGCGGADAARRKPAPAAAHGPVGSRAAFTLASAHPLGCWMPASSCAAAARAAANGATCRLPAVVPAGCTWAAGPAAGAAGGCGPPGPPCSGENHAGAGRGTAGTGRSIAADATLAPCTLERPPHTAGDCGWRGCVAAKAAVPLASEARRPWPSLLRLAKAPQPCRGCASGCLGCAAGRPSSAPADRWRRPLSRPKPAASCCCPPPPSLPRDRLPCRAAPPPSSAARRRLSGTSARHASTTAACMARCTAAHSAKLTVGRPFSSTICITQALLSR